MAKKTADPDLKEMEFEPGDLSDRAAELLENEFDGDPSKDPIDPVEESILSGKPVVSNAGVGPRITDRSVLPELQGLFEGKDYLIKEFFPEGLNDIIDTGEIQDGPIRVKHVSEPDDIYSNKLDPRLERMLWVLLFGQLQMQGQAGNKTLGEHICVEVTRMARGSGVPVVSWLRQKLWNYFNKRRSLDLPGVPKSRTAEDSDKQAIPNIRLRLLVEWSIYELIVDIAETNGCSNSDAFRYMLKYVHDQNWKQFA